MSTPLKLPQSEWLLSICNALQTCDCCIFALPIFLFAQSLLGCFLFKTKHFGFRWLFVLIGLFWMMIINILFPFLFWPFRNKSSCSLIQVTSCIYIGIVDYKLFEVIHCPSSFCLRHNITKTWQMFICLITPSIIDFNAQTMKESTRRKAVKSMSEIFVIIPLISFICSNFILFCNLFQTHWFGIAVLDAFVSWFLQLLFYGLWIIPFVTMQLLNIPSIAISLIFGNRVRIKYAYDSPLFHSFSPRSLWKCWSSVIGQSLKFLIYKPLGGRSRIYLSVPALFLFNCSMHIVWAWMMHSDPSIFVNFSIFSILGIAVGAQIYFEQKEKCKDEKEKFANVWFVVLYISVALVLMIGYGAFFMPFWSELFGFYGLTEFDEKNWNFYPIRNDLQVIEWKFILPGLMVLLFVLLIAIKIFDAIRKCLLSLPLFFYL